MCDEGNSGWPHWDSADTSSFMCFFLLKIIIFDEDFALVLLTQFLRKCANRLGRQNSLKTLKKNMALLVTPCWKVQSGLISNRSHPDLTRQSRVGSG